MTTSTIYSGFLSLFVVALTMSGCAGDSGGSRRGSEIDTASFTTTSSSSTAGSSAAGPQDTGAAAALLDSIPVVTHTATIRTTVGDIGIELYGKDAPKTVENFVGLARRKFFDQIAFHRAIAGFVVQAGDPLTRDTNRRSEWGQGGESIFGGEFPDEVDPATPSRRRGYVEGTLAMANRGPNTNSSQFFIVTGPQGKTLAMSNTYTIFGMVTSGMDVVRKIEATGAQGEVVRDPVRITSVTVDNRAVAGG